MYLELAIGYSIQNILHSDNSHPFLDLYREERKINREGIDKVWELILSDMKQHKGSISLTTYLMFIYPHTVLASKDILAQKSVKVLGI